MSPKEDLFWANHMRPFQYAQTYIRESRADHWLEVPYGVEIEPVRAYPWAATLPWPVWPMVPYGACKRPILDQQEIQGQQQPTKRCRTAPWKPPVRRKDQAWIAGAGSERFAF